MKNVATMLSQLAMVSLVLASVASPAMAAGAAASQGDRRIAADGAMACAIDTGGQVQCWGGGAGPGPRIIAGIRQARSLSVYADSACAVTREGAVMCWGENRYGPLGQRAAPGTAPDEFFEAAAVAGVSAAQAVVVAASASCALTAAGKVLCWGDNRYGQLGDGSRAERNGPVAVKGEIDAVRIAASDYGWCAILRDGAVACWGVPPLHPYYSSAGPKSVVTRPTTVAGINDATDIVMDGTHTCVLHATGRVSCWGLNDRGQLGSEHGDSAIPITVRFWPEGGGYPPLQGVSELVTRNGTNCAVTRGIVRCWGNVGWDSGLSALEGSKGTHEIEAMRGASGLAITRHSELCGAREGKLVCASGQFNGKVDQIEQIAAGSGQICAALKQARAVCWPTMNEPGDLRIIDLSAAKP